MSVPASPDYIPASPEQIPNIPIIPELDFPDINDDYLDVVDYEDEPYEDMDDEEEEDLIIPDSPEYNVQDWVESEDDQEENYVYGVAPLSPPPASETSSEPNPTNPTQGPTSTHEVGGSSTMIPAFINSAQYELYRLKQHMDLTQHKVQSMAWQMNQQESFVVAAKTEAIHARQRLDLFILDMSYVKRDLDYVADTIFHPLTGWEDIKDRLSRVERIQCQDAAQIQELRNHLSSTEIRLDVANFDRYCLRKELYDMQSSMNAMQQKIHQKEVEENCISDSIDVLAVYGNIDSFNQS